MARNRPQPEEALIESVTHDGRGIAAMPGKKVFVSGALVGEKVRFLRRKFQRKFDEAELLDILEPSANRIEARCAAFGRCGGCVLQHVDEHEQRHIKFAALRDSLERIGRVAPERWLSPLTGPAWNYRRRARLGVKYVKAKDRVLVGFRERLAPFIADMHRCEILAAPLDGMLDALSELVGGMSIRARLPQIEIAIADNATALVLRVLDPPTASDLGAMIEFGRTHSLRIYLQSGGPDSLTCISDDAMTLAPLHYDLPDFDVRIEFEPMDFVQVNAEINRKMVALAIELLQVDSTHDVLDLFCGVGNFSLPLARRAASVYGIEGEASLTHRATANAGLNGIANARFATADLASLDGKESFMRRHWDRVLLDPARAGAAAVAERIRSLSPGRLVYVSCHPGTLARDAGTLVHDAGYTLEAAGIIDMFVHTAHVESIAVFRK